ncbi:MAG: hypothetical protein ACXWIS_09095 [Burkholderiales bacterium]
MSLAVPSFDEAEGSVVIDKESNAIVLRSVRARQQFWIEERDRARLSNNDHAAGDAQRLIDEYNAFIEILKHQSGVRPIGLRSRR